MSRSLTVRGEVRADHTLMVIVPIDVPVGPTEVTLTFESEPVEKIRTFGDLLRSGFVGSLPEDSDLPRTNEEFRAWRKKIWERPRD